MLENKDMVKQKYTFTIESKEIEEAKNNIGFIGGSLSQLIENLLHDFNLAIGFNSKQKYGAIKDFKNQLKSISEKTAELKKEVQKS